MAAGDTGKETEMKVHTSWSGAVLLLAAALSTPCLAQESRSAPLAAELRQALSERQIDVVAAVVPGQPDRFVAASLVPGLGLLVLSARSSAAAYLTDCVHRKQYKDAYSYLNGTALPEGKVFIHDAGADGLQARRAKEGAVFDITYQNVTKQVKFDGDAAAQRMSDGQYQAAFATMDAEYAKILTLLIGELKK